MYREHCVALLSLRCRSSLGRLRWRHTFARMPPRTATCIPPHTYTTTHTPPRIHTLCYTHSDLQIEYQTETHTTNTQRHTHIYFHTNMRINHQKDRDTYHHTDTCTHKHLDRDTPSYTNAHDEKLRIYNIHSILYISSQCMLINIFFNKYRYIECLFFLKHIISTF